MSPLFPLMDLSSVVFSAWKLLHHGFFLKCKVGVWKLWPSKHWWTQTPTRPSLQGQWPGVVGAVAEQHLDDQFPHPCCKGDGRNGRLWVNSLCYGSSPKATSLGKLRAHWCKQKSHCVLLRLMSTYSCNDKVMWEGTKGTLAACMNHISSLSFLIIILTGLTCRPTTDRKSYAELFLKN